MIPGIALLGLGAILSLVLLVQWIILLVKVFTHGGVGLGLLGVFCSPFTYIWGWVKSSQFGLKKLMVWLTLVWLFSIGSFIAGGLILSASPEGREFLEKMQEQVQEAQDQAAEQGSIDNR